MNPNNSYVDIEALLQTEMAESIATKDLRLKDGKGDAYNLENAHVEFAFTNIENNYVRLWISSKSGEAKDLGIVYALYCLGAKEILTELMVLDESWSNEKKVIHYLKCYNKAIIEGFFDAAIAGDFAWKADYDELELEAKRLQRLYYKLSDQKHPEASAIWKKRSKGDMTWMDDVKRLTAI